MDAYTVHYVASDWMGTLDRPRPLLPPRLPGLNHERRVLEEERVDVLAIAIIQSTVREWNNGNLRG